MVRLSTYKAPALLSAQRTVVIRHEGRLVPHAPDVAIGDAVSEAVKFVYLWPVRERQVAPATFVI